MFGCGEDGHYVAQCLKASPIKWFSWLRNYNRGKGMGEHLLRVKRMHSRKKSILRKGTKGTVHKKRRECGC